MIFSQNFMIIIKVILTKIIVSFFTTRCLWRKSISHAIFKFAKEPLNLILSIMGWYHRLGVDSWHHTAQLTVVLYSCTLYTVHCSTILNSSEPVIWVSAPVDLWDLTWTLLRVQKSVTLRQRLWIKDIASLERGYVKILQYYL